MIDMNRYLVGDIVTLSDCESTTEIHVGNILEILNIVKSREGMLGRDKTVFDAILTR